MRHLLAYIATYTIGAMLIIGAALFAWMRSSQVVLSDESTVLARFEPAPAHEFEWEALGRQAYVSNCQNCHGADGRGWDQYPGIDHTAQLLAAQGGRAYLIDVHLHGLTSDRWRAPMPPMRHMPDVQLAALLNHVLTNFGNRQHLPKAAVLYLPADIAARRSPELSPEEVNARRPTLEP